jgi:hypothetical protein
MAAASLQMKAEIIPPPLAGSDVKLSDQGVDYFICDCYFRKASFIIA